MKKKLLSIIFFLSVFLLAAFFRFSGVNWDQNQHLHPDERFLTMVAGAISWPNDLWEYLNTPISPLNPHNRGFGFFVYGTFPLFFTKWVAESLGKGDYGNLTLVGRQLSAIFDLGTVVLVFLIAKILAESGKRKAESKISNIKFLHASRFTLHALPLLCMFFYSIMVLPIQLSHFFAVETYLTFFITLSFFLLIKIICHAEFISASQLVKKKILKRVQNDKTINILNSRFLILNFLLGISFGLAIASKISALLFLPIIVLTLFLNSLNITKLTPDISKKIFNFLYVFFIFSILFFISSYLTLRLAQPYLFANPDFFDITLNQKVIANWKQLRSFDDPNAWFPPGVQWIKTAPYIFPLGNIILWGLGLPMGLVTLFSLPYLFYRLMKIIYQKRFKFLYSTAEVVLSLVFFWIVILFGYQGIQFSKTMRYFYPIYPFLAITSALLLVAVVRGYKKYFPDLYNRFSLTFASLFLILLFIWPAAFNGIYSRKHSRVLASEWIYTNIPAGSTIAGEHWDDFLPLSLPDKSNSVYRGIELPLYGVDTLEKWRILNDKLKMIDYIILSSNRLYGSIMTVNKKYPITNRYYESLFDGSLGFQRIAEFSSRPNLPILPYRICLTPPNVWYGKIAYKSQECPLTGISFVDDYSEEAFTVYDHPKVLIFKKIKPVDYVKLLYQ